MSIVDRIREVCKERGTSIKAMEREIGLGNGTISRWETNIPSYDKVIKVADYLQTSFYWLILGKEAGDLTEDERKLVDTFRGCSSTGKLLIQEHADTIRKTLPAEQENQDAGVSTSAIG